MDVLQWYEQVHAKEDELQAMVEEGRAPKGTPALGPLKRNSRGQVRPEAYVFLATCDHVKDCHGQHAIPGFIVGATVRNAARSLMETGRPFRLATEAEIQGYFDQQQRNLASRKLEDAKADRTRPFLVQVPGE